MNLDYFIITLTEKADKILKTKSKIFKTNLEEKSMNKKFLAAFLAANLVLSLATPAIAEQKNEVNIKAETMEENQTSVSLFFASNKNDGTSLKSLLTPGKEYTFPIMKAYGEKVEPLKESDLSSHRLSLRATDGSLSVAKAEIALEKGEYVLKINPIPSWKAEKADASFDLYVIDKENGKKLLKKGIDFTVGFEEVKDDVLENIKNGETVTISENAPVVTEELFSKMDNASSGKAVSFSGRNWEYKVRVTGQKTLNLINNPRPIKALSDAFPDSEIEFFNFPGGSEFNFMGTLTLDLSNLPVNNGQKVYVYRYYKGVLKQIDATINEENKTATFNTKWLGNFIATTTKIKDCTKVENITSSLGSENKPSVKPSGDKVVGTGALR